MFYWTRQMLCTNLNSPHIVVLSVREFSTEPVGPGIFEVVMLSRIKPSYFKSTTYLLFQVKIKIRNFDQISLSIKVLIFSLMRIRKSHKKDLVYLCLLSFFLLIEVKVFHLFSGLKRRTFICCGNYSMAF